MQEMHVKAEEGLSGLNLKGLRALKQKSMAVVRGSRGYRWGPNCVVERAE